MRGKKNGSLYTLKNFYAVFIGINSFNSLFECVLKLMQMVLVLTTVPQDLGKIFKHPSRKWCSYRTGRDPS